MDHLMIRSPIDDPRLARCIGALAVLVLGSAGVARAAQDPSSGPRLREAEDFVLPRASSVAGEGRGDADAAIASESARADVPGPASERRLAPVEAAYLAANPAQEASSPQDPPIPHHPALSDRWFIGLGGFFATSTTEARLDSPSGVGTTINFEDVFGMEDREWTPQALARFRMTENWRLELEYFALRRDNSTTIDTQIDWGGSTYPINTRIDSRFNVDVTRLSAGYSFFKRPDKEIGVAFGFHLTNFDVQLKNSSGGQKEGAAALAPLPVFSLYGQFALTDTWEVDGRFDVFKLEYDPYQGSVVSTGLDLIYQPWRHVGFGCGWRSLKIDLSVDRNSWQGSINADYQGPIAFMFCSF